MEDWYSVPIEKVKKLGGASHYACNEVELLKLSKIFSLSALDFAIRQFIAKSITKYLPRT
jgi:hypothetical protein